MAVGTIQRSVLTDIANAIRVQNGGNGHLPSLGDGGGGARARRHEGGDAVPGRCGIRHGRDLGCCIRRHRGRHPRAERALGDLQALRDGASDTRALLGRGREDARDPARGRHARVQLPRRALLRRARRGDPGRLGGGPRGLQLRRRPPLGRREALRDARRVRRRLLRGRARQRELPLPRVREPRGGGGLRGALRRDQHEPDVRELPLARDDLGGRVHLVRHERVAHVQRLQQARRGPGLRAGADGQPRGAQLWGGPAC